MTSLAYVGCVNVCLPCGHADTAVLYAEPTSQQSTHPALANESILLITENVDQEPSRSSSADLLDAFEFFHPSSREESRDESARISTLCSPTINIIGASTENLASDDEMNYVVQMPPVDADAADNGSHDVNNYQDDSELSCEDLVEIGGSLVREDTVDFDEIIARPSVSNAQTDVACSSVWVDTEDSGIGGEFRATFSVSIRCIYHSYYS